MMWYGPGGWWLMGLFWLGLLAIVAWLVVRLVPAGGRDGAGRDAAGRDGAGRDGSERGESPEEILDRRFARGEIDEQTYRAQRTVLTSARNRTG